ncbi:MAG TPA: AmmeMemoRadiSam system radical SAM enzyme [Thermoleophilia bacterium]|nr:AmmeMemoRadiSam system radical SAM enzyme [Thermoleophilia bacterium]
MGDFRPGEPVEASLWEPWRGVQRVHCFLCAHHCRIAPGEIGLCGVRKNIDGTLYTLVYGCPVSTAVDPIEKKPLFHFLPGTLSYSVATVGCNLRCLFCQNAEISQMPQDTGRIVGRPLSPEALVAAALDADCRSISFTYTEPTIFYEYARDCARLGTVAGLKNVFVTNGYMTAQTLRDINGDLHGANVDLKAFSDDFYRRMAGARLKPVLDSIRRLWEMGVWVEVTTLLIPGHNDSPDELRRLAAFLVSVSPDIPWHVSRFYPTYRLLDAAPTPVASVELALQIGREEGIRYVYGGNIPGHSSESTMCPDCGETVIERRGFSLMRNAAPEGRCPRCSEPIAGNLGARPARSGSGPGANDDTQQEG